MSTLAIMKARLQLELRRSNIDTQIAAAINTAIEAYQDARLRFNETREFTFSTVANQEFYDSDDQANLAKIVKFDYVKLYVGNSPYELDPEKPEQIEWLSQNGTSTGQPLVYCWYNEQIRIYPIPDAVYTVRIGCVREVDAPASDGEANNPWMTKAERLIRSRAKFELYTHVLLDLEKAKLFHPDLDGSPTEEAFRQLKDRTNQLAQQGGYEVTPTAF